MLTSLTRRPDSSLHILFTIIGYAWRSGSETHVRDLALGLVRRGHKVTIFAPTLGELAFETRRYGVNVTDSISQLKTKPDLIHGNHVIPLAEAFLAFPQTPALWTCHDWLAWHDEPPLFPQILRYAAVDEICSQRVLSAGVAPSKLILLPNSVDLSRIPERPSPLHERPVKAAVFGKANAIAPMLAEACGEIGAELTRIGDGLSASEPERVLVGCDLVFATARAASEALACGCAVIVVDARGFGGLVTSHNYPRMRDDNFGLRRLVGRNSAAAILEAARAYDPIDAAAVTRRHRTERNIDSVLNLLEETYGEILAEPLTLDRDAFDRSLAHYLRQFTPHASADANWPWHRERTALQAELAALEAALHEQRAERCKGASIFTRIRFLRR